MSTEYFKTTPLKKWPTDKVKEYLSINGLSTIDTKIVSCNGLEIQTMKLKIYRKTFGFSLGERIYLIIRERIEKEEDSIIKMGISPIMSPIMSPIKRPIQSPSYSPQSAPIDLVNSSLSDFKLDRIESPKVAPTTLSDLSLDNPIKLFDFKKTDERAMQFINKKRAELKTNINHTEQTQTRQFLNENPPLLWHKQQVLLFLNDIGITVTNQLDSVDIDDFIMNSTDEFELIFRGKGRLIYESIRSKFINPDIKKIPKPAPNTTIKPYY